VDYEIKGHEMQLVEIELDPRETVIAEAGAMMFLDNGIDFKTKFGDGSEPKQTFYQPGAVQGPRRICGTLSRYEARHGYHSFPFIQKVTLLTKPLLP
jgi:uncharacterized protein (AIM24 family)